MSTSCYRSEAQALLDCDCTAEEAALRLGPYCSMVVITDGANGSCLSAMGRLQVLTPASQNKAHYFFNPTESSCICSKTRVLNMIQSQIARASGLKAVKKHQFYSVLVHRSYL